ncbi:MAG: hypothetical protein IJ763_04915 [Lachnospiraceae bacterium]|nr:hypothetical protein [Lachnospiraceae bacterium]MBR1855475.1 hypothetical protein [Oribacterium sp.]
MKKTTKTKLIAAALTSGVFLAGFTGCRAHKDDKTTEKTTAEKTTTEIHETDTEVPATVYGPPSAFDDETTTEEITTESYNPEDDVPEDVYGPPEDFE